MFNFHKNSNTKNNNICYMYQINFTRKFDQQLIANLITMTNRQIVCLVVTFF